MYTIESADWTGVDLPVPVLWRLLIEPIRVEETTSGGIVLAPETQKAKEYLRYVGKVLAIGDGAYQHPKFTGIEINLQIGDWVVYQTYSGFDIRVHDATGRPRTLRFINDDEVMALAPDPNALLVTI